MEKRIRPGAQNLGRMVGSGMDVEDFIELTKRTECDCTCVGQSFVLTPEEEREDFVDVAIEIGRRLEEQAETLEKKGNKVSAANFYWRSCAMYRVADYGVHGKGEEKLKLYAKLPETFQKYLRLRPEHVEVVEIPFERGSMPGYFAIPDGTTPETPVLVFIAGATGFKEENWLSAMYFFERGIPVIIFDGPGQGEAIYFRNMLLTADNYVTAVKAVIDYVKSDSRVGNKVALYGISYGGFLATQAACALNDDICGLVVRGGTDKTDTLTKHSWMGISNFYLNGFAVKFGTEDMEECSRISSAQDCTQDLHKITVPLIVVHSQEDPILGVEGAHRIYDMVSSTDKYYAEYPGNTHCVEDKRDTCSCELADWMCERMLAV